MDRNGVANRLMTGRITKVPDRVCGNTGRNVFEDQYKGDAVEEDNNKDIVLVSRFIRPTFGDDREHNDYSEQNRQKKRKRRVSTRSDLREDSDDLNGRGKKIYGSLADSINFLTAAMADTFKALASSDNPRSTSKDDFATAQAASPANVRVCEIQQLLSERRILKGDSMQRCSQVLRFLPSQPEDYLDALKFLIESNDNAEILSLLQKDFPPPLI